MSGNVKQEVVDYDDFIVRIVQLMQDIPSGINDKVLLHYFQTRFDRFMQIEFEIIILLNITNENKHIILYLK